MPLPVSESTGGGNYKKVPPGTHRAVCNLVADLGQQRTTWQGQEQVKPQVYLRFETPDERVEYEKDGVKHEGPLSIGATYTASLSEKANLRHILESWRGRGFTQEELKGFDLFNILGKPCLITVSHTEKNGKVYANIVSVTGMLKGMEPPKPENPLLKYSADEPQSLGQLPDWLKKKIGEQVKTVIAGDDDVPAAARGADLPDDDIPF
jgi:hypothetical protein